MDHRPMTTPHMHAEQIKAWVDGAEIQYHDGFGWCDVTGPSWRVDLDYRVKPIPLRTKRYRRWISQQMHDYIVTTLSEGTILQPDAIESIPSFVRWIDAEWQEGIEV